jgi:hypothetical protein
MGRSCSTQGGRKGIHMILVGKPEGKITLEDLDIGGKKKLK